jgi:hypothetical protein
MAVSDFLEQPSNRSDNIMQQGCTTVNKLLITWDKQCEHNLLTACIIARLILSACIITDLLYLPPLKMVDLDDIMILYIILSSTVDPDMFI